MIEPCRWKASSTSLDDRQRIYTPCLLCSRSDFVVIAGQSPARCQTSRSQSTSVGSFLEAARKYGWDIIGVDLGDDPRPLWMGDSSLGNATWPAVQHEVSTRGISSGRPLRLGSHWRLNERRNETMRDKSGRDNLCS